MESTEDSPEDFESNKVQILQLAKHDGKMVAPIDLSLESAKPLQLDSLRWANLNSPPAKLKLSNTGNTVLLTGKWTPMRPYIFGGPLDSNYVFSQMHFHWGSDEHEGSEHKVKGICYPMEIHVVFFKTRYLTQAAALKSDDGLVIVVYLVKLLDKSTSSLHMLASHLEKIIQPRSSVSLPLSPLSSLIVPFTKDYLLYWGSIVSRTECAHSVLWIVSRATFGISVEDLTIFRKLLDCDNEQMKKNFRATSPQMNRHLFHVNPSSQIEHLLLRGTVEPTGQTVIVNFSQVPNLNPEEAKKILSKGDSQECGTCKTVDSTKMKRPSSIKASSKTFVLCEGLRNEIYTGRTYENSTSTASSYHTKASSRIGCRNKFREVYRTKSENRNKVIKRKKIEKERKCRPEKIKKKISVDSSEGSVKKLRKSLNGVSFKRLLKDNSSDLSNGEKAEKEENKNGDLSGFCIHLSGMSLSEDNEAEKKNEQATEQITAIKKSDNKTQNNRIDNTKANEKDKNVFKSKLPTPIKAPELQSTLARYFSKPEAVVRNQNTSRPTTANAVHELSDRNTVRKQVTTSIPRPVGKNAGKFPAGCLENELSERNPQAVGAFQAKRPLASPVKPMQESGP